MAPMWSHENDETLGMMHSGTLARVIISRRWQIVSRVVQVSYPVSQAMQPSVLLQRHSRLYPHQ